MKPEEKAVTMSHSIDPMIPIPYGIRKVRKETADTFTLHLQPQNGEVLDAFQPGQFNMIYVYGLGEVPISISGDPDDREVLVHTIRNVGTVTSGMARLGKGDVVGVRGPYGSHWPVDESAGWDILIVAGGIGLAPLRPAIYQVLRNRSLYGRVVLLYGTRTPHDLLYRRELHKWRGLFDLDVLVTVDHAVETWYGEVGVVPKLVGKADVDPSETIAMICGPEIMMRYTIRALEEKGLDPDQIYISMERNMKCAVGFCGHCQFGPTFICKDGPVFRYDRVKDLVERREL